MPPHTKRRKTETTSLPSALVDFVTFFYPFLSVNDATNLGMTSREIKTLVDACRPSVSVLREERFPTKIGYENVRGRKQLLSTRSSPFAFVFVQRVAHCS